MFAKQPTFNEPLSQTEVLQHKQDTGRALVLNRPKALNALNLAMVRAMTPQLLAWEQSDLCKVIILKSSAARAFCAGGDVKKVVELVQAKDEHYAQFFEEEYRLNYLIGSARTPIVAIIDGITMGGGVGLSVHAPFRVATERTVFAMPETAIGLFPDVGGSHFLPRLDGFLGRYLGLTGQRLEGQSVFWAGIATHYVPSERLPALQERLCELGSSDPAVVNEAIEEFSQETAQLSDPAAYTLFPYLQAIDRCFRYDTVEEIYAALEREATKPGQGATTTATDTATHSTAKIAKWAKETLTTLRKMSPTSQKVTLELIKEGEKRNLQDCLQLEFRVAQTMTKAPDFTEGVTAKLIHRGKVEPQWQPATLEELPLNQLINNYFKAHTHDLDFLPITQPTQNATTTANPNANIDMMASKSGQKTPAIFTPTTHPNFALVTAKEVLHLIHNSSLKVTTDEIFDYFHHKYSGKIGMTTKLQILLSTKFTVDPKTKVISVPN
ncbi:ClpP/crotonase-like domain-containing protein [Dimargaris cristalligena]|uniref:3-hydroxyisobutyryl-CoA hydrolase n=1 Tax=Dimargaris cristalligena TaxID=215637 RepID=A0A4P9ZQK1_9FUNG|nr:ClpP/crotonase-like domain-containing protein [Dimargaris cristalligena]|eukprot:RKP35764.1 ClpP/crotonase-like domain-containing protein [Dimargaris cristalligena]